MSIEECPLSGNEVYFLEEKDNSRSKIETSPKTQEVSSPPTVLNFSANNDVFYVEAVQADDAHGQFRYQPRTNLGPSFQVLLDEPCDAMSGMNLDEEVDLMTNPVTSYQESVDNINDATSAQIPHEDGIDLMTNPVPS